MAVMQKEVRSALSSLGKSEKQIVKTLVELEITGVQQSSSKCVIAQFLKTRFPEEKRIFVDSESLTVNGIEIETPKALAVVINQFDEGVLPELVSAKTVKIGFKRVSKEKLLAKADK